MGHQSEVGQNLETEQKQDKINIQSQTWIFNCLISLGNVPFDVYTHLVSTYSYEGSLEEDTELC